MDARTTTYRDNPAGYGDFGAMIGEDEQGGEEGGFVLDGLLKEAGPGMCVVTEATRQFGGLVVFFMKVRYANVRLRNVSANERKHIVDQGAP